MPIPVLSPEVGLNIGKDFEHDNRADEHHGCGDVIHFAPSEQFADESADHP